MRLIKPVFEIEDIVVEYSSLPFNNGRYGLLQPHVSKEGKAAFIYIHPRQTEQQKLRVAIHEALHIAYPQLTELQVINGAGIIASVVQKAGFKKVK